ncbi:MAG TPA: MlaD family protein [Solirubrobacterales bacterium]|nr:MlaD family protein [Solirubrobacterales bacterium]
MRAVREHLRDFLALVALVIAGLATTGVVLSQQQYPYPDWIPFLGDDTFELRGEISTAQAVTPGQGQTVNIAGIRVGDVTGVNLEGGSAVVTMKIEERYAPLIRDDATMLLRPRTGLQDMTVEIDVGEGATAIEEGSTVPLAQTRANVMPDQILAALDADTQNYLVLLLGGGAEGLGGRGEQLSAGLRRFEPFARDVARINGRLAKRRESIRRAITSFREVSEELGAADTRLADFVVSSNDVMAAFARQEASLREAFQELPSTLAATRGALASSERLAVELGPASQALIPAAREFAPAQRSLQSFMRETLEPIAEQIRPFTRRTQPVIRHTRQAAEPLAGTTRGLASSFGDLGRLFNSLAYDPPGPQQSYLFSIAWLNHNTNNIFLAQDAHGPIRRGVVLQNTFTALIAESFADAVGPGGELQRPVLKTLQQLTNVPRSEVLCQIDFHPLCPPP